MLVSGGFADPVMDMDKLVYTYGDVDSLIRDLRNSGQTNAMPARRRGLMGRAAWKSMIQAYPRRQEDGRIQATMEIVYGHAWKIGATPRESRSNKGVAAVRWYAHRDQKT
jgi:malonyl-CoA O-methyltransferase